MIFEPIKINYEKKMIKYILSDGTHTYDKEYADIHEKYLAQQRLIWYNKRFSIWWEILYFLFKVEPKKPYNF